MKHLNFIALLCALLLSVSLTAQQVQVYPSNWWIGMKYNKIQIMLHGPNVGNATRFELSHPGVQMTKVNRFQNKNYIVLDVTIQPTAKPGIIGIKARQGTRVNQYNFTLNQRRSGKGNSYAQGVTSSDLMYLIMPDRFSNGDPSNDRIPGMKDQTLRRDTVFNRHGGDLAGIENHLDYLTDLGVTTIWLNPIWENDMPERTEHGYAFTNHYRVDPRLGGNTAYRRLIDKAHAKGIKVIQDAVYNHVGLQHHLFRDMPDSSWFHRWPQFTQTSFKDQTLFDPYAAQEEKKIMSDGWFVASMPDWNQHNPFVANFLIQHAIWSVEEFGIDGWRIDTYAYNDLAFMNRCNKALYDEYPAISIFGETWVHGVINQSYFCENNYGIGYKSNLQATTDFQTLFYGIQAACNERFGWTEGVNKLYTTLAQDVVYKNPMRQVIFLDNHDIARFYSVVGEDTAKYKMSLAWLLTCRGIPQLYYGGEVLMTGFTSPNDGYVRQDFPGGWAGDSLNKFTATGRTVKENAVFDYIKRLANFRKTSSALKTGKMMQYLPVDGVYVYFRYTNNQRVMCIMNTNDKVVTLDLKRFEEMTRSYSGALDVANGTVSPLGTSVTLSPYSNLVLELRK